MCGIVAIRSFGSPVAPEALARATACLRHRGPDGETTWIDPSGTVGLGHTRLAIIDPDGGAQPIASEDGRVHIVVNGELYGFEAVRRRLEGRGHRFRTRSDSEIALHLYEDHGERFVDHLRGQFAIVIWDERKRRLLAARDRFGIKPLYFVERGGVLYLASEAKALIAAGIEPRWDHAAVYRALHACPDPESSLFSGIRQLPPACVLLSTEATIRVERYWDLPAPCHDGAPIPANLEEEVRVRLTESVRARMRADVPVGCYLSGGLDSSAILGLGSTMAPEPMTAFTVGFASATYDERRPASEAAEFNGARHEIVPVGEQELADHFSEAVRCAEILQFNGHAPARFLLSRTVRASGFKCVLAGEGADELFFGYEFTRAAAGATPSSLVRKLVLATRLLRSSRRRTPGLHSASPWLARLATVLDAPPALMDRLDGGLGGLRSTLDRDFLSAFSGLDVYRSFYDTCDQRVGLSSWAPARQLTYLWLRSLFAGYHLAADRLDMAHGVEVRFPFLDHELFEFVQQIPLVALAGSTREKQLLRSAVAACVPPATRERRKQPFWAPPDGAAAKTPLAEMVQDVLRSRAATSVPMLDGRGIEALVDSVSGLPAARHRAVDSLLLSLASLVLMQQAYGVGAD